MLNTDKTDFVGISKNNEVRLSTICQYNCLMLIYQHQTPFGI